MDTTAVDTTVEPVASSAAPSVARNVVTESVGTFVLMLAGPGVLVLGDNIDTLAAAVSFGVGLAIAIGVIGAVANPMFSLALLLVREISPREAVGDWVGQVVGAIAGAAAIWGLNDQTRVTAGANGWDRSGFGELGTVIAAELVLGVILVVVLLMAVVDGYGLGGVALATGGAYAVGHLILLGIDGGGLNPARSLGSALFSDTDPNALGQVWVFVLVPLVATFVGVFVWLAVADSTIDDTVFDETILDDLQNELVDDRDD
ncbi:MAG: aquaporin [Actinomycetota bacterium]